MKMNNQQQQEINNIIQKSKPTLTTLPTPPTLPPLRSKFSTLLPPSHRLPLSFQHLHLLKILSILDQTILFSTQNRSIKSVFFQDLQKRIRDSLRMFINMKHLEQLLFLDEKLYSVRWEWSMKKRGYDLVVGVEGKGQGNKNGDIKGNGIGSRDNRKQRVRAVIVQYLMDKHEQFLKSLPAANNSTALHPSPTPLQSWHPSFNPDSYPIPCRSLPPHPQTKQAQLRCFQNNQIQSIKNKTLKALIQEHKERSQVGSYGREKSLIEIMFKKNNVNMDNVNKDNIQGQNNINKDHQNNNNKLTTTTSTKQFQQQLYQKIRQRQAQNQLKSTTLTLHQKNQSTNISPITLLQLSQQILYIYLSLSVSNLFKIKLIQLLLKRINLKYTQKIVLTHLQYLMKEMAEVGFLKEVRVGKDKPVIVQVNRNRMKEVKEWVGKMSKENDNGKNQGNNINNVQIRNDVII